MGNPKFRAGDRVRLGGDRPLPAAYPWIRRGRLCTITYVQRVLIPAPTPQGLGRTADTRNRKSRIMYWLTPRKGRPPIKLESYHLRHPNERDRQPRGN